MTLEGKIPPKPWYLISLYIVIILITVSLGFIYYKTHKNSILHEKQIELSAISDLKIRQINQWRQERLGDAGFLGENILIVTKYLEFLKNPEGGQLRDEIILSLKSLTDNFDYKNALIIDNEGVVRLAYPAGDTLVGDHLRSFIADAVATRKAILTDLHRASVVSYVHLDLIIPLIDHSLNDTLVLGAIVMRVDPQKVLYPLIHSWPAPSKSAETLLFRKENEEILYLNRLRHYETDELILRKPVTLEKLPESMALNGILGTVNGIDYRNVQVVAVMSKVPGTTWYMVSKIDRDEVFITLNSHMRMVIIILILFILSIGLLFGFFWWNQRVRYYRELYNTELNRLALVKHFDYILKFANDIILLFDKDLTILEANDRALETYMYTRDELIGMKLIKIRAPESLAQLNDQLSLVDENKSATFITYHIRKDKSIFPVEISSRLVNIEGSKYYQTIGRDITERKYAEDALRDSEDKFRKIFEDSPFPTVMTGKDFGITRANEAFSKMTGYSEEELIDLTFRDFTHPDHIAEDEISLLRLIAGEIPIYKTEKRYIRKDTTVIWGSTTVIVIRNSMDEVQFFLAMVEDITSRKKTEQDLIAAKEKAEENDRLKTAFLHNVSHEIRTPMNAIIGFATLLNEDGVTENERIQYCDIIYQSSTQLLSIISDIVDIANVESGQVKLNYKVMNINSSLKTLCEQYNFVSGDNKLPVRLIAGVDDEGANITTDGTKLIQIISNLINNSMKFTRQGEICFGYTMKDRNIEFFVKDTGIGIAPDHIDKIFDRFYQVDRAVSRQYGGTGLGLSICKAYVELLGGKIWVKSKQEEGTIFKFTIPILSDSEVTVAQK